MLAHFATNSYLPCDMKLICQRETSKEKGQLEVLN